jgi:hypothetical protein
VHKVIHRFAANKKALRNRDLARRFQNGSEVVVANGGKNRLRLRVSFCAALLGLEKGETAQGISRHKLC